MLRSGFERRGRRVYMQRLRCIFERRSLVALFHRLTQMLELEKSELLHLCTERQPTREPAPCDMVVCPGCPARRCRKVVKVGSGQIKFMLKANH